MMERLKTLVAERPDEKVGTSIFRHRFVVADQLFCQTLIVSQWTGCLSLVSDYLTESGVIHVK